MVGVCLYSKIVFSAEPHTAVNVDLGLLYRFCVSCVSHLCRACLNK